MPREWAEPIQTIPFDAAFDPASRPPRLKSRWVPPFDTPLNVSNAIIGRSAFGRLRVLVRPALHSRPGVAIRIECAGFHPLWPPANERVDPPPTRSRSRWCRFSDHRRDAAGHNAAMARTSDRRRAILIAVRLSLRLSQFLSPDVRPALHRSLDLRQRSFRRSAWVANFVHPPAMALPGPAGQVLASRLPVSGSAIGTVR